MSDTDFKNAFEYKVIYVFSIDDENHKGLVKIGEFNLKLDKYITRVVEQGSNGTKIYTYADEKFGKIEIDRKTINGTNLVLFIFINPILFFHFHYLYLHNSKLYNHV